MSCQRCNRGWRCEQHPDAPFPHDECAGPGIPCDEPGCRWWVSAPGVKPLALTPEAQFDEVLARRDDDDETRH